MNHYLRTHRRKILPLGILSGLSLGIIARAWMRWISTDPEFTWAGTLYIVLAFVIFATTHSFVYFVRESGWPRRKIKAIRIASIFFSLPLFVAAGSTMFPTVLFGSLAKWRSDWWVWARLILAAGSVVIPVTIVRGFGNDFGWGLATVARALLFIAIYVAVITFTRSTVAPLKQN